MPLAKPNGKLCSVWFLLEQISMQKTKSVRETQRRSRTESPVTAEKTPQKLRQNAVGPSIRNGTSVSTERLSGTSWSCTCLGHWGDFPSKGCIHLHPTQPISQRPDPFQSQMFEKRTQPEFNLFDSLFGAMSCSKCNFGLFFFVFPRCIFDFIVFRIHNSGCKK